MPTDPLLGEIYSAPSSGGGPSPAGAPSVIGVSAGLVVRICFETANGKRNDQLRLDSTLDKTNERFDGQLGQRCAMPNMPLLNDRRCFLRRRPPVGAGEFRKALRGVDIHGVAR